MRKRLGKAEGKKGNSQICPQMGWPWMGESVPIMSLLGPPSNKVGRTGQVRKGDTRWCVVVAWRGLLVDGGNGERKNRLPLARMALSHFPMIAVALQ
jgi:hypothetical protein